MVQRCVGACVLALALACGIPIFAHPASAADGRQAAARSPALEDLLRRARSGDAAAQRMIGDRFERGNGVPQDYATAARWYREAARRGDVIAQRNLGYLFETGLAGEQSYEEAAKWYRMAAAQGDAEALRSLAYLAENGLAGEIDLAEAERWRNLAAGRADPAAEVAGMRREILAAVAPAPAGAESQPLTVAAVAASLEDRPAADAGTDAPVDIGLALNRNRTAALRGDSHAQYRMGMIYLTGEGVPADPDIALRWLHASAQGGYARAQAALGALYAAGVGVDRNMVLAYFWYGLAEERLPPGHARTMAASWRRDAETAMTAEQKLEAQQLARDWRTEIVPAMAW